MSLKFINQLKTEYKGYNLQKLGKDAMAGVTVAAVALPLALAFGVSCGADAAAGMITAVIAGIVISLLSGGSYQISGPTGAMTAVLLTIISKYQLQGVFIISLFAGAILLLCGIFRLGKLVSLIPMPVITGFTSGISVVIAMGQIDNFFGTSSKGDTAVKKIISYGELGFNAQWQTVIIGLSVILIMILWPKKWNARVPSSLVGIIIATIIASVCKLDIATVGEIPKKLFLDTRLDFSYFQSSAIGDYISSAFTIAILGMIESLLCGASASRMKEENFNADQELIAQGVGNMLIPFFGGVPATAAIARTSVAIKSGCQTRLTGIFHAIVLLLSMFLLGPVMSKLPLAALAGVLMVTAFRMNEWHSIKYFFKNKFKGAMLQYSITLIATVVFDLTVAIVIGVVIGVFCFLISSIDIDISVSKVSNDRIRKVADVDVESIYEDTSVVYITGALFFANIEKLKMALSELDKEKRIIFSFRGVNNIDTTAAQNMLEIIQKYRDNNVEINICGMQPRVRTMMNRAGIQNVLSEEFLYASIDKALLDNAVV